MSERMRPCVYRPTLLPCSFSLPPGARETVHNLTCEMQAKVCYCGKRAEEAQSQAALGVSTECFGGDAGRSLVPINHSRHDAPRLANLQGIPGLLRRNRDQYIGRSLAEASSLRNYHHETRPSGRTKADLL